MKSVQNQNQKRGTLRGTLPTTVVGLCGIAGFIAPANADTVGLVITGVTTSAAAGGFTKYSYTVALEPGTALWKSLSTDDHGVVTDDWAPDFVEIFDFAGLHGGVEFTAASGVAADAFKLSTTSTAVATGSVAEFGPAGAADSAGFFNLKAEYNRDGIISAGTTRVILGTLSALSIYSQTAQDTYISSSTRAIGTSAHYVGNIDVPLGPAASAPLPAVVWGGLGLFGLTGLQKLRRQKA